jgi:hypothetical protein
VARFFDPNRKFSLDCPNGHQFPFTLKQAGQSPTTVCPICGVVMELEGLHELGKGLRGQRSIRGIGRNLSRKLRA